MPRPADSLKVMMQRRHEKDPAAGALEPEDLDDDGDRLDDKKPADDCEDDLVLGRHRNGAERAANLFNAQNRKEGR